MKTFRFLFLILFSVLLWGTVFGQADVNIPWKKTTPASCNAAIKSQFLIVDFTTGKLKKCVGGTYVESAGSIGSFVAGATPGSVFFADPSGNLGENNGAFKWNNTSYTLKLRNTAYTTKASGWNVDQSSLQIGDETSTVINGTNGTYGVLIDINRGQTVAAASQTSGIRVRANNSKIAGTGYTTAVEAFVTNVGDTTAAGNFQALEGITQLTESAAYMEGGGFNTSGAAPTTTATTPEANGIRVYGGFAANWTVTDWSLYKGMALQGTGAGTITNLYGLKFSGWTGNQITNSYGIYMDSSIDRGSSLKYAFYSLSTSPSLFSGAVTVPSDSFSRSGWINNQQAVTKDAVNELNNQDRRVETFNDLFNNSNDDGGFTVQASVAGVFNNLAVTDFLSYNAIGLLNLQLKTGTTTKAWVAHPVPISNLLVASYPLGIGAATATFRFATVTASDGTNTYVVRAGIQSHTQQEPDNGCFFRQTNSVNSGLYEAVCRNATVETATNTGIATSATMKKYEVRLNAAGTSATFYVEDVLVATVTTNIPVASTKLVGACFSLQKSAGTTDIVAMVLDYAKEVFTFTTAR